MATLFKGDSSPDSIYKNDGSALLEYTMDAEILADPVFSNIMKEAVQYVGYPYVWGGSSPDSSFDCSGFICWVINNCGNGWHTERTTADGLCKKLPEISVEEAAPGDLVFFSGTYKTAGASHVGIYLGNHMMLHCGNPIQYSRIDTSYWQEHLYAFKRLDSTALKGIDYLVLVNKKTFLPDDWEESLEIITLMNSAGEEVPIEKTAGRDFLRMKEDLQQNDGICLEPDSGFRNIADQQRLMDEFIEKYGSDYASRTVAQPGSSEHHTGLALDMYLKRKNENGEFMDVRDNEELLKYPDIWKKVHDKLAAYGFILRYPEHKEDITGYPYEPWHIRYLNNVSIAEVIMKENLTLEEYLGRKNTRVRRSASTE